MRTHIAFAVLLAGVLPLLLNAQADDRNVSKGTVLNYSIKDGTVSYKLKATVTEWNPRGTIKIQWQTTGAKVMKGSSSFPYKAFEGSPAMKAKLKPGTEVLTGDMTRWFTGYEIYSVLYDEDELDLKVDDKDVTLTYNYDEDEMAVLYNKTKTPMDYAEGENDDTDNALTIGFIAYNYDVAIVSKYVKGSFAMNLVSIESPVVKTTTDLAREILDAVAPKGVVPLKKMEPKKFAEVKAKYPLLATIENFDPTKGGSVKKPITETYEYRQSSGASNPPSLVDCLTGDIRILYNQKSSFGMGDMTETIGTRSLPATAVKKILLVYTTTDFNKIPGYRPWTHWSFVRSLGDEQRSQLATELEGYVSKYGFIEN